MKMITKTNKTPMKKNIYIYLAIICISISNVNAQDYLSFYNLEDYVGLEMLVKTIPEGSELLLDIAKKFTSVGMCTSATKI